MRTSISGGMIAFELKGGMAVGVRFMDSLARLSVGLEDACAGCQPLFKKYSVNHEWSQSDGTPSLARHSTA